MPLLAPIDKLTELREKLVKQEQNDWEKAADYGARTYKKGWSDCASHFIQMIDDFENGTYSSTNLK